MNKKFRKRKNLNYKKIVFIIVAFISLSFISLGYSYLKTTLAFYNIISIDSAVNNCYYTEILGQRKITCYDNKKSQYVTSITGIDYTKVSSETNGNGIYTMSTTKNDSYPIVYYRGNIADNNVLFADKCWKIVRTTETGGTKILYNGTPDSNGSCNNTGTKTLIGTSAFNSKSGIPFTGYMYGVDDYYHVKLGKELIIYKKRAINSNYYFSSEVSYDSITNKYTLVNPQIIDEESNDSELIGKYTLFSTSANSTDYSINYIAGLMDSNMYYIIVDDKESISSSDRNERYFTRYYSSSFIKNDDGSFNLENPQMVKVNDWITDYANYNKTYTCEDGSIKCDTLYIVDTKIDQIDMQPIEYLVGNSFTYKNGKYYLQDTKMISDLSDRTQMNSRHYTCLNSTGECEIIDYIFSWYLKYESIKISNGVSIKEAFSKGYENNIDSLIKTKIDEWYEANFYNTNYEKYLEDTIYCYDRRVTEKDYLAGAFNPNGGNILISQENLNFHKTNEIDLSCDNNDAFTISNTIGNGKLNYSIGLITYPEVKMAGMVHGSTNKNTYLQNGEHWWTANVHDPLKIEAIYSLGYPIDYSVGASAGIRPMISLNSNIVAMSGEGTPENPYVIK